jgi:uncharacterized membrane protein YuzA (DUF378 family)
MVINIRKEVGWEKLFYKNMGLLENYLNVILGKAAIINSITYRLILVVGTYQIYLCEHLCDSKVPVF